jgi:hypothetical protein
MDRNATGRLSIGEQADRDKGGTKEPFGADETARILMDHEMDWRVVEEAQAALGWGLQCR